LWVGTESGAARFNGSDIERIKETTHEPVSAITIADGAAYFATEWGSVFESRARPGGGIDTRALLNRSLTITSGEHEGRLALTSINKANGRLFVGSLGGGLLEIDNGAAKGAPGKPATYFINALERDKDGKLWAGGAHLKKEEPGVFTGTEPGNLKRSEAATGPVTALRMIGDEMWIGTDGRGVFRIAKTKTQRFTFDGTAGGLRSDHVYAIFEDREGVIWFGTDRGVCRLDPHAPRVESVGDNPESNFIRALYQTSSGRIFAGTNRGLFVYDEKNSIWNLVPGLGQNIIYAVAEDKSQRLLVAAVSGFYVAPRQSTPLAEQVFSRFESGSTTADSPGSVRAIAQFNNATYYAVYGRGVERVEGGRSSLTFPSAAPSYREVISLLADGDQRLLIGTAKEGVFTSDGKTIREEPAFGVLKGPAVRSMARTPDGSLWFGTSNGVYLCKPDGCILAAQNVDARYLIAGQSDQVNEVWCATRGNGLLRILLDPVIGPVISELDSEQGLPSQNVFAVLPQRQADGSDLLLIGTSRGIARYEPGRFAPALSVTRLLSKRVHAPSELQAGLNLEYPQNSLLVDVTAISSRTFPEQFQYAFTLADSKGQLVKQKLSRESQFTMEGLKPGKYTVTARAFTKDLTASAPLSFSFTVAKAPFPWTSTALAILLALALLALLWAILERRRIVATSAALVDANRELADARLNLANEAERERRRIARDLHDQTLADLRHLALLTDQIKPNGEPAGKQTQTAALRSEIESISQEVRRICEDLSPSVLQNVGFAAALEFALTHAVQDAPPEKRFEYEFHCDDAVEEKADLAPSVQMQIYRIVQEAVNNIWRHAAATEVKMFVTSSPVGDFSLRIEDNGRPFTSQHTNAEGRGLANMRARAGLIDARIAWEEREGGGTVFTLTRTPLVERVKSI
jgi:signal transduction histidine kinase/ligand-binding sensor domain-containing protein